VTKPKGASPPRRVMAASAAFTDITQPNLAWRRADHTSRARSGFPEAANNADEGLPILAVLSAVTTTPERQGADVKVAVRSLCGQRDQRRWLTPVPKRASSSAPTCLCRQI